MNRLTVVVPIYQVEDYIVDCVRSLVEQTYQGFDVIFVNDHTKDQSIVVLEAYLLSTQIQFNWVILHNEQNLGLAASRNRAIAHLDTEFVMFLDSDDFLDPTMFETLFEQEQVFDKEVDVACYGFKLFDGVDYINKGTVKSTIPVVYSWKEAILAMFGRGDIDISACSKIFRTSLFKRWNIEFPSSVYYEDVLTVCKLIRHSDKIILLPYNFYTYRCKREGSIMNTVSEKHLCDNIRLMDDLELYFQEEREILLSSEFNSDKFFNVIEELLKLARLHQGIENNGLIIFSQLQQRLSLYYKRLSQSGNTTAKVTILYYYFSGDVQHLKWNYIKLGICLKLINLIKRFTR